MAFPKAVINHGDSIALRGGESYFFDTTTEKAKSVIPTLLMNGFGEFNLLDGHRGSVLVSFRAPSDTYVGWAIALQTGPWYVLPQGGLREVNSALYGAAFDKPPSIFEDIERWSPGLLEKSASVLEPIAETTKKVAAEAKSFGSGAVSVITGAAVLAVVGLIVAFVVKVKRR